MTTSMAEGFRKIHLVIVPTPPFQALTMTLHIKLFALFLSLASHSQESRLCRTSFLSPLDMGVLKLLLSCRFISLACGHSSRYHSCLCLSSCFPSHLSLCFSFIPSLRFPQTYKGVVLYLQYFQGSFFLPHMCQLIIFFTKIFSLLHKLSGRSQGSLLSPSKFVCHALPLSLFEGNSSHGLRKNGLGLD